MLTAILNDIDQLKIELNQLRPLDSQSVCHALDIEYTYESNRIEGNTLTLSETALVIDKGMTVSGKSIVNFSGSMESCSLYCNALELCHSGEKKQFLLLVAQQVNDSMKRLIKIAKGG